MSLQQRYNLRVGIDAVVEGRMPIGGLSSSAAVGIAYLLALETANGLNVTPAENILLDRYVENVYPGLNDAILGQSIILMSDRDHLTFLDCQSVEFAKYPMPADKGHFEILVVYSGVASSLACTDYNSRVAECQEAARMMLGWAKLPIPAQPRLRMVPDGIYGEFAPRLPEPLNSTGCNRGPDTQQNGLVLENALLRQTRGRDRYGVPAPSGRHGFSGT